MKPIDPIKSVQIRNSYIEKEHIEDKYSRLDIKAITNNNEHINIEIQVKNDNFHNAYRLKEINTNEELTDTIELHFIEIPKLRKLNDTEEIKEAKSELLRMSADSKDRFMYEKRKESILEKVSLIESAEQKGIKKGLREGKIEIAINLLDILDDETISIKTGLEIDYIKNLRNKKSLL